LESILNKFEGKDTNLEIYSSGFYVDPSWPMMITPFNSVVSSLR